MYNKKDIKNFTLEELKDSFHKLEISKFRAKQVFEWIYKKDCQDFFKMTNLADELKQVLDENFYFSLINVKKTQTAKDGVIKYLFELEDGNFVETVMIPNKERNTICISTQVGCKYKCVFCASGSYGFTRNLTAGEIISQIYYVKVISGIELDNFVFMGIGEPFDNYDNLVNAIKIMNDPAGFNIAARRITVSTNGVVPGIEEFKNLGIQANLAVSLHAVTQEKRKMLMPIAEKYSLSQLLRSCQHYYEKTHRIITLEYILLKGLNDKREDAFGLAEIAKELKAKVNIIPYSPIFNEKILKRPESEEINRFFNILVDHKVSVTVRNSKGNDIKAACGQLAGKLQKI
jgi:23S rRNA (adenine2503-C2)-methyltransferase